MNGDALAAMKRQGLAVVAVDPAQWRAALQKGHGHLRGDVVPAPFFDAIAAARDDRRARAPRRAVVLGTSRSSARRWTQSP